MRHAIKINGKWVGPLVDGHWHGSDRMSCRLSWKSAALVAAEKTAEKAMTIAISPSKSLGNQAKSASKPPESS